MAPLISLQAMLIIYYYVLFLWVNGTVKPFQVAPVELVDYLLGKTIYYKKLPR
jgi:hypothetical protein